MHIQWTGSLRGLLAALVALFLLGCEEAADTGKTAEAPAEVGVIVARPAPIGITSELPGRLEAYRQAEVRARVAGIVTRRLYEEGQDVRAGTVLFQIDPAPLKAALDISRGALARAEASHAAAADKLKRYADLIKDRAISEREYTEAQTDARQALAQIASAKAELEQARLRLGYATVTAPIDGRARRALVTEGALVGEDSPTPLTRVEQIDPIYVNFSQPAGEVAAMQRAIREGQVKGVADKDIAVRLVLADGSEYPLAGELLFSDLAVDPGTDTIAMRALFRNPHRELLPGGYVQVRLQRAVNPQAITVPRGPARRADPYRPVRRGQGGQPTGRGGRRGGPRRHPAGPRLDHQPRAQGRRAGDRRERRPACRRLQRPGGGPPAGQRRRPLTAGRLAGGPVTENATNGSFLH